MTLQELLSLRHSWADDETIYVVRPWSCQAEAILSNESPDTTEPSLRFGKHYDYFLEGFIARELLEDLGAPADVSKEATERVISYAINDA